MTRGGSLVSGWFDWGSRSSSTPDAPAPSPEGEPLTPTTVLPRFLAALGRHESPVVLDVGPVVGSNVEYFGDVLACKIHVKDLFEDVEAAARNGTQERLLEQLLARLPDPESVDGIICWDLFDFLPLDVGREFAARMAALLRPGGVLYGFFGTTKIELTQYTRFVVEGDAAFSCRFAPATPCARQVFQNRELGQLFPGLELGETVLLKTKTRETLFRRR